MRCKLIPFLLFAISTVGCNAPFSSTPSTVYETGAKPFRFDPQKVTELVINKFNPETGDRWQSRLTRQGAVWQIADGPHDQTLMDRMADETFIFHLLDTLQTIRVEAPAPKGTLESFNLDPPRFALKWKTPQKEYEFRMGSKDKTSNGSYLTVNGEAVYITTGSVSLMLDLITSFKFIRRQTWSTLSADDVDEIEISRQGKKVLYAQREGEKWTDRTHQAVKPNMNVFLENLTHAQIEEFVDDPQRAKEWKELVQTQALYEIRLSGRLGISSSLLLKPLKNTLIGFNSSRPSTVFILNQKLLPIMQPF